MTTATAGIGSKVRLALLVMAMVAPASAMAGSPPRRAPKSEAKVRRILRHSQHLGAHGMGYNTASMFELSRKLSPDDIPTLLSLLRQVHWSVDGEFGLASLCEPAIGPVRKGFESRQISFVDADDILNLMANFDGCPAEARQHARDVRQEITETIRRKQ